MARVFIGLSVAFIGLPLAFMGLTGCGIGRAQGGWTQAGVETGLRAVPDWQAEEPPVLPFSFREADGAAWDGGAADAPRVDGGAGVLTNAWAGGLNAAHIAALDLNGDGQEDLIVFDRNAKKPLCFVYAADAVAGTADVASGVADVASGVADAACPYVYAPAYADLLPPLREWVQAKDYNGDGLPDLFTFNGVAGISVYRNVSRWETDESGAAVYRLRFEPLTDRLQAQMYGQYGDLYCISVDYPALVDVDGDGALDVLNFWVPSTGDYLHYYRNHTLETYGTLDSFDLRIADWSWGCFAENEESNGIYLDSCRPAGKTGDAAMRRGGKAHEPKHSGSTLCALPRPTAEGPVYDLLLGDVDYAGLMYLHNGGTPDYARITAYDSLFPSADAVRLVSMPVVSVLPPGVAAAMGWDTAARTYICVSPYSTDALSTQGRESLWVYELDASGTAMDARRLGTDFLQADMLDAGALSCPTWFDYNGDGRLDLVVGYAAEPTGDGGVTAGVAGGLALYENVGTASAPAFKFVTDDFLALRRDGLCARALSPAFGDYDGDGKPELVLGTFEGRLLAYGLTYDDRGAAAEARLRDSLFLALETSGHTAPVFFDLDHDGLDDLVVGCKQQMWTNAAGRRYTKSSLIYYRHTGAVEPSAGHPFVKITDSLGGVDLIDRSFSNYGYAKPAFYRPASDGAALAETYLVCGGENGRLKAYALDGRRPEARATEAGYLPLWRGAAGSEASAQTASTAYPALDWSAGRHSAPALADLNGDGLPDLVVGNACGGLTFAWGMPYRSLPLANERPGLQPDAPAAAASVQPLAFLAPNPAGATVTLRVAAAVAYTLADAAGHACRMGRLPAGVHTLPLAGLPAGLYVLQLRAVEPAPDVQPFQSLKLLKR